MEGLSSATPFARLVADSLDQKFFTLIDVGCSAGIDPVWRLFGKHLRAFGFDPNLDEIARLTATEVLPGVSYVPGFVGLPSNDPGMARFRTRDFWARSPWSRLSVAHTLELRAAEIARVDDVAKTQLNIWHQVQLADPERPIVLPEFLRAHGVDDIDFIKIDVDGPDFLIIRSLQSVLHEARVIGVSIETNFFGSDDPEVHTFHNLDRLMKAAGFELFGLSSRPYSTAALPAQYAIALPAQTVSGRPLQGDAIYLRDAAAPEQRGWAHAAGPHKLAKLAAVFSLTHLPDCAAELLVRFRDSLASVLDVTEGLDTLTSQVIHADEAPVSYAAFMAQFESDGTRFYPAPIVPPKPDPGKIAEAEAALADLRAEAERAVAQAHAEAAARAAAEHATKEAQRQATALSREVAALTSEIAQLRASTSWRLLAPLRATVDSMRRIGNGGAATRSHSPSATGNSGDADGGPVERQVAGRPMQELPETPKPASSGHHSGRQIAPLAHSVNRMLGRAGYQVVRTQTLAELQFRATDRREADLPDRESAESLDTMECADLPADWSEPIPMLRRKWGQIPAGDRRQSSADLLLKSDDAILSEWVRANRNDTEGQGFGVRGWYHEAYRTLMSGKKVLDIGCGMALSTLSFAEMGAQVTFVDIIPENVELVRRLCRIKQVTAHFLTLDTFEDIDRLPADFDVVTAIGSLINAPLEVTRIEVALLKAHLRPCGRWLHLAYPKARWIADGKPSFTEWGKMTDGPQTPWMQYHDREIITRLFAPSEIRILFECEWHDCHYNWFDIELVRH